MGQFLLSAELFLTLALAGALVAAIALWRLPGGERPRLRALLVESLGAVVVAGVLLTPYLVHAFVLAGPDDAPRRTPLYESADVANYLLPARRTWLQPPGSAATAENYTATGAERGAYIGLPLLVLVALFSLRRGRDARRAVIALSLLALVLLSLGPRIRLAGTDLGPGPWLPFAKLPVTESALPVRLTLFVSLLAALASALWLAEPSRRTWLRWALALAALAALAPNPAQSRWTAEVPRPVFFTGDRFERHLPRGQTALVLPYGPAGWSLLWQAESGMAFRLVGGHLGRQVTAAEEQWRAVYRGLGRGEVSRPELIRFLREHQVRTVVVAPGTRPRARRLVEGLGFSSTRVADVLVVRLPSLREAPPPPQRSARPRARHGPRRGVGVERDAHAGGARLADRRVRPRALARASAHPDAHAAAADAEPPPCGTPAQTAAALAASRMADLRLRPRPHARGSRLPAPAAVPARVDAADGQRAGVPARDRLRQALPDAGARARLQRRRAHGKGALA